MILPGDRSGTRWWSSFFVVKCEGEGSIRHVEKIVVWVFRVDDIRVGGAFRADDSELFIRVAGARLSSFDDDDGSGGERGDGRPGFLRGGFSAEGLLRGFSGRLIS